MAGSKPPEIGPASPDKAEDTDASTSKRGEDPKAGKEDAAKVTIGGQKKEKK